MKIVFWTVGILLGIGLLTSLFFSYLGGGMPMMAKNFFSITSKAHGEGAYQLLSRGFKSTMTQSEFGRFIEKANLKNLKRSHWQQEYIRKTHGAVVGYIELKDGQRIHLRVEFVKEDDSWRIRSISKHVPKEFPKSLSPAPG